jgi:signal transduction histidine kinase
VSHDLRTHLGGIVLAASLLIKEADGSDAARSAIRRAEAIQKYAVRMNRLMNDLVDATSIEARRFQLVVDAGDAVRVVEEAVATFRREAAEKSIALEMRTEEELPPARFDQERILQVLSNLLSNALKFTSAQGQLVRVGDGHGPFYRFRARRPASRQVASGETAP